MKNKELGVKFGWNENIEKVFFDINRDIPKGSFQIQKRKGNYYWYYKLSKGSNRLKYLCRSFEGVNENNQTSFVHCLEILKTKLTSTRPIGHSKRKFIHPFINEYIDSLIYEGNDPNGRRKMSTIKGMVTSLRRFKKFCIQHSIRVNDIDKKEFRNTIRMYIVEGTKDKMSRNTIRKNLIDIRSFLNWMMDDDIGKGLIHEHYISRDFLIQNYPVKKKEEDSSQHYFSSDHYRTMYKECIERIRKLWIEYCENGYVKQHPNQPIGIGSDVVFFISLFQLGYGFRVGEILNSYRNFDSWNNRIDKKSSSSYFTKHDDKWFLMIKDYKNKDGMVGIHHTIRTWSKPPTEIPCIEGKEKGKYWDTNIVDVCHHVFPKSTFMFPSPNYKSTPNKTYSINYYMNLFKSKLVNNSNREDNKYGWERYGVRSSHDLRDYFISYNIINGNLTPYELSTITRHKLSTMEKYYVRLGYMEQYELMMKISQQKLFT
jgi:hypothetical protein